MNEVIENIKNRRNTKNFENKDVSVEDIKTILDAGTWAPNHRDTQPWRFVVIQKNESLREKIINGIIDLKEKDSGKKQTDEQVLSIKNSVMTKPVLIFVYSLVDDNPIVSEENYGAVCCAIQNISLTATSIGLATGWSTGKISQIDNLKTLFKLEENLRIVGVLTVGYPKPQPSKKRKKVEDVTKWI